MEATGSIPRLRSRHLALAALAALGLHAAAAAGVFWQSRQPGTAARGSGGLEIGISGAPGAPAIAASSDVTEIEPAEIEPAEESALDVVADPAEAVAELESIDAEIAPTTDATPVMDEVVATVAPEAATNVPVEPATPEIAAAAVASARPVARPPRPAPARQPASVQPPPAPPAPRQETQSDPALTPKPASVKPVNERPAERPPGSDSASDGAAPKESAAASDASDGGALGGGASGGGSPAAEADYTTLIKTRLARAKQYPRRALSRRLEGVGRLRFTVVRDGRATGGAIVRSSGHALIDKAILDMLGRAQPFPAIPAAVGRSSITFELDIRFQLP